MKKPPGKNESHEKSINGKKYYWCGKPGCCKWGDHKSQDHPNDADANHADHVGDDGNSSPQDTSSTTDSAHFLSSSSLHF